MNIYDKIAYNILYYMDKLDKDEEFVKKSPNITAFEYLCGEAEITPRRLSTILKIGEKKRPTVNEVYRICTVLGIGIENIISNKVKYIESKD